MSIRARYCLDSKESYVLHRLRECNGRTLAATSNVSHSSCCIGCALVSRGGALSENERTPSQISHCTLLISKPNVLVVHERTHH
jgi:hypothetical protein